MQAVIQSLESFVLAMAVAAFAHFGIVLKDVPAPRPQPAAQRIAELHTAPIRTIRRAPCPLAKDIRRA
jgi:hypothetical protein